MNGNFAACLQIILQSEGGFVDDSDDPGGPTCLGITIGELSGWLHRPATVADIKALSPVGVAPIYLADYWNVAHCDSWPLGVDLMIFDEAVNQGPGRAIRTLQSAVNVAPDGLVGPRTVAVAGAAVALTTIDTIKAIRLAYYRCLPTWPRFGDGWTDRLNRTAAIAQQMVAHAAS